MSASRGLADAGSIGVARASAEAKGCCGSAVAGAVVSLLRVQDTSRRTSIRASHGIGSSIDGSGALRLRRKTCTCLVDEEVKVFLIGDAASCAKANQRVPQGYYNLEVMLRAKGWLFVSSLRYCMHHGC